MGVIVNNQGGSSLISGTIVNLTDPVAALQNTQLGLTFAGIPFALDNEDVWEYIDSHIDLIDSMITLPSRAWPGYNTQGLTSPIRAMNRPKLRIGWLYYPSDASRWAEFHGIVTDTQLRMMMAQTVPDIATRPQKGLLQMNQVTGSVAVSMYMLPPRCLGKLNTTSLSQPAKDGLWLVSFVDERYYWNYKQPSTGTSSKTDWQGMVDGLATDLNISIRVDNIATGYGTPPPNTDLFFPSINVGQLLDTIASNTGHTVARNYDGSYNLWLYDSAGSIISANAQDFNSLRWGGVDIVNLYQMAGKQGELNAVLPKAVKVLFPMYRSDQGNYSNSRLSWVRSPLTWGDFYSVTVNIVDSDFWSPYAGFDGTKVIVDTARALINSATNTPTNLGFLNTLANFLANDFWDFMGNSAQIDAVYNGIIPWFPDGLTDLMFEWNMDGCSTRVMSKPYNYQFEQMMHAQGGSSSSSSSSSSGVCQKLVTDVACVNGSLSVTKTCICDYIGNVCNLKKIGS